MQHEPMIDTRLFEQQYLAFRKFVEDQSDVELSTLAAHPYVDDQEGYKYRTHSAGRAALNLMSWSTAAIGTGRIRDAVIAAIELPENNLVSWKARYGEESRAHRALLEARTDVELSRRIEDCVFRLYTREQDPEVFSELVDILGKRYSLIAYLFFLKDRTRYLPIAPEYFDRAFELLGVHFRTSGRCSWENYCGYLGLVDQVRGFLGECMEAEVSLLDAHSFLWMLASQMAKGKGSADIQTDVSAGAIERTEPGARIVYFNNCHNRDHLSLFRDDAFFDLDTTGRHARQARDLPPGQLCVAVTRGAEDELIFGWYSLAGERLQRDSKSPPEIELKRVFYGKLLHQETVPKGQAVALPRYAAFFRSNGHLKIGSVFYGTLPADQLPVAVAPTKNDDPPRSYGAGFGNSVRNKLIEMAAMNLVRAHYENDGWHVTDVSRDCCGFDLRCARGPEVHNVEVKGVSGTERSFIITANEVSQAQSDNGFVLAVVTSALSDARELTRYTGSEFIERFQLGPIQYYAKPRLGS